MADERNPIFEVKATSNAITIRVGGEGDFRPLTAADLENGIVSPDGETMLLFEPKQKKGAAPFDPVYPLGTYDISVAHKEPAPFDDFETDWVWQMGGGFTLYGYPSDNAEVYWVYDGESHPPIDNSLNTGSGVVFEWQSAFNNANYWRYNGATLFEHWMTSQLNMVEVPGGFAQASYQPLHTEGMVAQQLLSVAVLVPSTCIYTKVTGLREVAKAQFVVGGSHPVTAGRLFVRWYGDTETN